MENPLIISIMGSEESTRDYVGAVIETSLAAAGFNDIENKMVSGKKAEKELDTLLDYAMSENPGLFSTSVDIVNGDDINEDSDEDATEEETESSEEDN